jgi:hypothetical protein
MGKQNERRLCSVLLFLFPSSFLLCAHRGVDQLMIDHLCMLYIYIHITYYRSRLAHPTPHPPCKAKPKPLRCCALKDGRARLSIPSSHLSLCAQGAKPTGSARLLHRHRSPVTQTGRAGRSPKPRSAATPNESRRPPSFSKRSLNVPEPAGPLRPSCRTEQRGGPSLH